MAIDEIITRENIADEVTRYELTLGQNPLFGAITNYDDVSASITLG
jgi:hypothetical protein